MPYHWVLFSKKHESELFIIFFLVIPVQPVAIKQTHYHKEEIPEHTGGGPLVKVCSVREAGRQRTQNIKERAVILPHVPRQREKDFVNGLRLVFMCCMQLNVSEK